MWLRVPLLSKACGGTRCAAVFNSQTANVCDCDLPSGRADVIGIEKTNEFFRLLYDVRGRFAIHRIGAEEAKVRQFQQHANK